ncbi:hypothetical protein QBC47DRAFT_431058 [Echria macrotheca]|uniref:Uncharacterized protein n=1 Tax=Echria macrotheca TaxID=438768 RepID=A0AAJ0B7E7_9PEZI|nr:hypothetical protein QBC47DRAFT_431058 [Echria macrotheca]
MPQQPRGLQPGDGVGEAHSVEGAAHSVEEAAPTRPLKRKRREDNTAGRSRGPRSLPTPPAPQPQTWPNSQTHALNGTIHPQFDPSTSKGIALCQAVLLNDHIVTDPSPGMQFTANRPRDGNRPDRERCGDNGAGLQDDPTYVPSPPAPQAEGVVPGLTLPELSGTVEEQLETLIDFGNTHWPQVEFFRFRSGKFITGAILTDLLSLELKQFPNYAVGITPERAAKATAKDVTVVFDNVNGDHWVVAIVDKIRKTFTAYGMAENKLNESKAAYQDALQVGPLEVTSHPLQDYTGNTCALRCCDALAKCLGTRTEILLDQVPLRLFYLQRLLQSCLHAPVEDESPGAERRAGQLPGVTPLDTPAQLQAFASRENNPSLTGSVDSPTTVAAILELRLATDRDRRAGSQFQVDLQRTSEPQSQSHPDEAGSFGADMLGIDHATQQEPRGVQQDDGAGAADSWEPELEGAQQLSLLSQLPDAAVSADTSQGSTPKAPTPNSTPQQGLGGTQPGDEAVSRPEPRQHGEPPASLPDTSPVEPGVSEQVVTQSQMMQLDSPQLSSTASSSKSYNANTSLWGATGGANLQARHTVNPTLLGLRPLSDTSVKFESPLHALAAAAQSQAVASPGHSPPFTGSANNSLAPDPSVRLPDRLGDPTAGQGGMGDQHSTHCQLSGAINPAAIYFDGSLQPQSQFDLDFEAGDDEQLSYFSQVMLNRGQLSDDFVGFPLGAGENDQYELSGIDHVLRDTYMNPLFDIGFLSPE